jgi:hypothetical protein
MISAMRQHDAKTQNGAITHSTTLNNVLDLYFVAGASKSMPEESIIKMFIASLTEDTLLTIKLLFWSRDIREGAGVRRFFNICLKYLKEYNPELILKNIHLIPEYGRWSDLFDLITLNSNDEMTVASLNLIKSGIEAKNGLLAKWLPRKGPLANFLRKKFEQSPKQYRKMIVELSNTVEQKMCSNEWESITYSHVPSLAMNKYRKHFYKHDGERFKSFIEAVKNGEAKINAGAIYPHQLYQAWYTDQSVDNSKAIEAQWYALPNYLEGSEKRILPVCDVSGSMHGDMCIDISVALGIYISERNEGPFKDAFITFSETPEMVYLKGTFTQRLSQLRSSKWGYSTNLQKTFDVLLDKAIKNNVPQEMMPSTLLIISDMEFNSADKEKTNLEIIIEKYKKSGYEMPSIIFWNVRGVGRNNPANSTDRNIGLVSGYSPSTLEAILHGDDFTPVSLMLKKLNSSRYEAIKI